MIKNISKISIALILCANFATAAVKDKHTGKVIVVKNTPAYTYVKLQNDKKEFYWAAIMKAEIKEGETITLSEQVWMNNFKSKALNREFDKILFADMEGAKKQNIHGMHGQNKKKPQPEFNKGVVVSEGKATKVKTINEIFLNKENFKNKNVEFTATVVKASNKVMGNTWVKLYDGKDFIIFRSSNEDEDIKISDKVRVSGTINTDVNYGYGFKYEVIGVNAKFTKL